MTKTNKLRSLTAAAVAAFALSAAQPAAADTIEINNWWAGAGSASFTFNGTDWHTGKTVKLSETGGSGGFKTYDLTTDPGKKSPFESFCVDIFHSFNFAVDSKDTQKTAASIFGAADANALGLLYTNHHAQIDATNSSADNESAFQLAVWEIVNEKAGNKYDLSKGDFQVTAASGNAKTIAQKWLDELVNGSVSKYVANVWTVQSMITKCNGVAQDVVTFSKLPTPPVPEPQTYAMMLVGLGLLGFSARRRNQEQL
jgi:hypothetical protein